MTNRLLHKGAFVEADSTGERTLRIFTRWNGSDNVMVAHTHASLSSVALAQGQRPRALSEVMAALQILQGKSVSVLERTRILAQQSRVLTAMGRSTEAAAIAESILAQRRASIPDEPLMIGEANQLLGELRILQRRMEDAEPLLLEAYASYNKAVGPTHAFIKQVAATLVFLYAAWGKPDRAAPFVGALTPEFVAAKQAAARKWARQGRP